MRPFNEPPGGVPDLEIRGACVACGGTLSVRLRPVFSRCVCRRCGYWAWARVDYESDGVRLEHTAVCDA